MISGHNRISYFLNVNPLLKVIFLDLHIVAMLGNIVTTLSEFKMTIMDTLLVGFGIV